MKTTLYILAGLALALTGTSMAQPSSKTNSFVEEVSREQRANVIKEREAQKVAQLSPRRSTTIALNVPGRKKAKPADVMNSYHYTFKTH